MLAGRGARGRPRQAGDARGRDVPAVVRAPAAHARRWSTAIPTSSRPAARCSRGAPWFPGRGARRHDAQPGRGGHRRRAVERGAHAHAALRSHSHLRAQGRAGRRPARAGTAAGVPRPRARLGRRRPATPTADRRLRLGAVNAQALHVLTGLRPLAMLLLVPVRGFGDRARRRLAAGRAALGAAANRAKHVYMASTAALFAVILVDPIAGFLGYVGAARRRVRGDRDAQPRRPRHR